MALGLSQRGAATMLGVGTGAAVGHQIAKWHEAIGPEQSCRELSSELDRRLRNSYILFQGLTLRSRTRLHG